MGDFMEKKEKYEQMYEMLVTYERKIHEKNQKRISIGLKCIIIIPLIFLFLLFLNRAPERGKGCNGQQGSSSGK